MNSRARARSGSLPWTALSLGSSPRPGSRFGPAFAPSLPVCAPGLPVDDRLDHGFRVGEGKRAVGVGNIAFGGPVGRGGELADVVSRAVSLSLGDAGQLAAFLLDRIDHANQSPEGAGSRAWTRRIPRAWLASPGASGGSRSARTTASPSNSSRTSVRFAPSSVSIWARDRSKC